MTQRIPVTTRKPAWPNGWARAPRAVLALALLNLALAGCGATLPAQSASAQPADATRIRAFMASAFYQALISRAMAALPPAVLPKCPGSVPIPSHMTVLKPITFADDGFPNAGAWVHRFPISGCGNDTVLNFYFTAGSDEKVNTVIALPGTTAADPVLQRDAQQYAFIGAGLAAQGCQNFIVRNTVFEGFGLRAPATPDPGPAARYRPWWESWTMAGCGRMLTVPIDFVPDATGTRIIQPGGVTAQ